MTVSKCVPLHLFFLHAIYDMYLIKSLTHLLSIYPPTPMHKSFHLFLYPSLKSIIQKYCKIRSRCLTCEENMSDDNDVFRAYSSCLCHNYSTATEMTPFLYPCTPAPYFYRYLALFWLIPPPQTKTWMGWRSATSMKPIIPITTDPNSAFYPPWNNSDMQTSLQYDP